MVPVSIKCDLTRGVCFLTTGKAKFLKMPSDVVSMVTTGLGVSLVAGILSGVAYVLAHNVGRKKRSHKKKHDWYCEICGAYLHTTKHILNEDLVTCTKCGAKVCSQKCAKFMPQTQWVCKNCLDPKQAWYQKILKAFQPGSLGTSTIFENMVKPEADTHLDSLQRLEKEQVRDFIEKLVNVMLGEDVDNASVGMLYNDRNYQNLFKKYHRELSDTLTELSSALRISISINLPVTGTSPCTAHAALKQLIEKLLKEAVNLPLLQAAHAHPPTPQETSTNSTYEDLLATAIINKVVTGCQNNLPTSSANSVSSSRHSTSSRHRKDSKEKEYFFGEETLDAKWKTTDLDTTSVSSLEEWLQSESSFGSRKYVDKVTLMIKQDIEEAEDVYSENGEEGDAEYFQSTCSILSDSESNWFLQKRQFQGTHSPVPVPMLVPNPTADAKVLIGDKPIDDTSDLSDAGSDIEELVEPHTTHTLLLKSKNIIGGGKTMEIVETVDVRSESSTDSGVKEVNGKEQKSFDVSSNHRTDISLDDDNIEDSSYISVYSNTEKEAEYTEKYASLPRQILRSSTPLNGKVSEENSQIQSEESFDLSIDGDFEFTGGNYSKKEKEKWKHAIEMENNPYSKENIERRINRSGSAAGSIFGPDYYARKAGKPSGGEKDLSTGINGVSWPPSSSSPSQSRSPSPPPPELPKVAPPPRHFIKNQASFENQETTSTVEIVGTEIPPAPPKTKPPPKSLILDESDGIHQALKAIVTPVEENMPQNIVEIHNEVDSHQVQRSQSYNVQMSTSEITSDSDLSFVNFYDVEHSQVIQKTKNEDVVIPIKAPALYKSISEPDYIKKDEHDDIALPVAKPRIMGVQTKQENGHFIKNTVTSKQRNIEPPLKRNLSQSSLIEDSFDAPPKVLHQKKDNTIISKIYKDPKVRLYAMNSREELLGSDSDYNKIVYRNQKSYDAKEQFLAKARSEHESSDNSEYESGKTGKMSFFSSEEDLLSLNSESNIKTPQATTPKKFIYSSNEDLLSLSGDELNSISQRKAYQVANMKNFALQTEYKNEVSTHEVFIHRPQRKENDHEQLQIKNNTANLKKLFSSYEDLSSADISLEHHPNTTQSHTIEPRPLSQQSFSTLDESVSEDLEEVARRHVVKQTLGKFSKSEFSLTESRFQRGSLIEDNDNIRVSVRDLRKKFECCDVKSQ
ncbi:uncharacterized protein LOC126743472 isoform X2 [Anthonomus grandis grandis]|uniref:uncharacterized protein LOC126743472 isoform X2 n=1 Tax=Anthonomus grandis grandis TaxID=2921223 RepID=UPI00216695F0|nr:uncharacterized protein LOC126743472 isoform X2 [Anthonomus grandis grandis]